jgi:hypothetical protein
MNFWIFVLAFASAWYLIGHAVGAFGLACAITFVAVKLKLQERYIERRNSALGVITESLGRATEELRRKNDEASPDRHSGANEAPAITLRMGFRVAPSDGGSDDSSPPAIPNMFDVPELMRLGRWEQARVAMEKLAYSMSRESPENQELFKELATKFASVEPFYQRHVSRVVEAVRQNPGIKQSAIYELIPDLNKQDVRYVLYFADQLQQVQRVKKGNTYLLNVGPSTVSLIR